MAISSSPALCTPERLEACRECGLGEISHLEGFHRVTRLAARLLELPAVFLVLISETGLQTVSAFGLGAVSPDPEFCDPVIADGVLLAIEDTRAEARYRNAPLVRDGGVLACLGAPVSGGGQTVGALYGLDFRPREWSPAQAALLEEMAALVNAEVELCRRAARERRLESELALVAGQTGCVLWSAAVVRSGERFHWDARFINAEAVGEILGVEGGPYTVARWFSHVPPEEQRRINAHSERALRSGSPGYHQEYWLRRESGEVRWLSETVRIEPRAADRWQVTGVATDITEWKRKDQEQDLQLTVAKALARMVDKVNLPEELLRPVCRYLGCEWGELWEMDRAGLHLRCTSYWQDPASDADLQSFQSLTDQITFARGEGVPGTIWSTGEPLWMPELRPDVPRPRAEAASQAGFRWGMGIPVCGGGVVVGVLLFFGRVRNTRAREYLPVLTTVGGLAGQFLERRRSLVALRESEALHRQAENVLQSVMDRARCLLWTAEILDVGPGDLGWILRPSSEEAAQRFLPLEIPPGKNYAQIWYLHRLDEDKERTNQCGNSCVRRNEGYSQEFRCYDRFGNLHWVREDVEVEAIAPGYWHAVGVCTDITELKRTTEVLRDRESRLQILMQQLPGLLWCVDKEYRITAFHGSGMDASASNPADVIGRPLFETLGTDDPEFPPIKGHRKALAGERATFELEWEGRFYQTQIEPLRDQDGQVQGAIGFSLDVTERREFEERKEMFRSLGQLLNSATTPEAAARVVLEVADRLIGWDSCWLELAQPGAKGSRFMVLIDEINGERTDLPNPLSHHTISRIAEQAIAEGPLRILRTPEEVYAPKAEGEILFGDTARRSASILAAPIRCASGTIGVITIHSYQLNLYTEEDLSTLRALADYCAGALERTHAEAERRQLEEQLRQSQKMEAVGRLAGGVAHDFNNMLAVINGYSELLQELVPAAGTVGNGLREIHRAGLRAADLTRQLLAFSRKQILTFKVLDLNEVVAGMESMLRRLIGEDIHLETHCDPSLRPVKADPGQIEQVILNLAVNARDAMPHGGRLTIQTRAVEVDWKFAARHPEVDPGAYVQLAVTDTGVGMPPEVQERIWEPFFTTKEVGEGTGLGLATVYGIIKANGGHVEVESETGKGTTFRIYFPVEAAGALGPDAARPESRPRGSETILLVEDEEMVRGLVGRVLQEAGYVVLDASHGEEALLAAARHKGPIHLLLTDVVMPGRLNGRELAEQLAATRPEMKVMFMSGFTEDAVVRRGVEMVSTAFIHKPFAPLDLALKVRTVLDGEDLPA